MKDLVSKILLVVFICAIWTSAYAFGKSIVSNLDDQSIICEPVERHVTYKEFRDLRRWVKRMQDEVDALKK